MSTLEIVSEGSLSRFSAIAFANRHRLRKISFVTPWVTEAPGKNDFLAMIVEASTVSKAKVRILTRPPKESWHRNALAVMNANLKPTVLYNPQLHAKLYILECDGFRYALLGSPNFTRRADRDNVELAIEFGSSFESRADKISSVIHDLILYANALFADDDARFAEE
jgi:HKD family nuclease